MKTMKIKEAEKEFWINKINNFKELSLWRSQLFFLLWQSHKSFFSDWVKISSPPAKPEIFDFFGRNVFLIFQGQNIFFDFKAKKYFPIS